LLSESLKLYSQIPIFTINSCFTSSRS